MIGDEAKCLEREFFLRMTKKLRECRKNYKSHKKLLNLLNQDKSLKSNFIYECQKLALELEKMLKITIKSAKKFKNHTGEILLYWAKCLKPNEFSKFQKITAEIKKR